MKRCRTKDDKRLCRSCHVRRARFRYRGRVKYDDTHGLCFRCYRSVRDAARAKPATPLPATEEDPAGAVERLQPSVLAATA
jgi:hypothetical protein